MTELCDGITSLHGIHDEQNVLRLCSLDLRDCDCIPWHPPSNGIDIWLDEINIYLSSEIPLVENWPLKIPKTAFREHSEMWLENWPLKIPKTAFREHSEMWLSQKGDICYRTVRNFQLDQSNSCWAGTTRNIQIKKRIGGINQEQYVLSQENLRQQIIIWNIFIISIVINTKKYSTEYYLS